MTQEAAYILNIKGSTETIQSLNAVQKHIADIAGELKQLKTAGSNAEKEFNKLVGSSKALETQSAKVKNELKQVDERMKQLLSTNKQASKEYKELKERKQELIVVDQKLDKQIANNVTRQKQLDAVIKQTTNDIGILTTRKFALQDQSNNLAKAARSEAKAFEFLRQSYDKDRTSLAGLERNLRAMRAEFVKLDEVTRSGVFGQRLQQNIAATDAKVKQLRASLGQFQQNVGNYPRPDTSKALVEFSKQALGAFGVGSALYVGVGLLQDGADAALKFETGLSHLQGITKATDEQMEKIGDRVFEISELFGTMGAEIIETVKLVGNAFPELLQNTELLLEVSKNAEILSKGGLIDIKDSVDLLAVTMNAFNLTGEKSGIVIDVVADAAVKGTVPIEVMAKELKDVALTAKQSGLTLEQTVAAIQAMGKAGVPFNKLGVGLRNILTDIAKTGRDDLNPALTDFGKILDTLDLEVKTAGDAIRFFDEQNLNASLGLISQKDLYKNLTGEIGNYNAAMELAAKNTDNTENSIQRLKTAFSNLFIAANSNTGASAAVRVFLNTITDLFTAMNTTTGNDDLEALVNLFERFTLVGIEFSLAKGAFKDIIDFIKGADEAAESATKSIEELNRETLNRIKSVDEEIDRQEIANNSLGKYVDLTKKSTKELRALKIELESQPLGSEAERTRILGLISKIDIELKKRLTKIEDDVQKFAEGTIGFLNQQISELNKVLQNTTSETVITQTVKQITELQLLVDELELKIKRAKNLAAPGLEVGQQLSLGRKLPTFTEDLSDQTKLFETDFDAEERARQERIEADKEAEADLTEFLKDQDKRRLDRKIEAWNAELARQQEVADAILGIFDSLSSNINQLFSNDAEERKKAQKQILLDLLKFAEIAITTNLLVGTSAAAAGGPLAPALAIKQAIVAAVIKAAFAGIKALVGSYEEGGVIKGGLKYKRPGSKDDTLAHVKQGEMILTEHNQAKAKSIFGENVFGAIGVKGFGNAPVNNYKTIVNEGGNTLASLDDRSIDVLADVMSDRVAMAIIQKKTGNRLYDRVRRLRPRK